MSRQYISFTWVSIPHTQTVQGGQELKRFCSHTSQSPLEHRAGQLWLAKAGLQHGSRSTVFSIAGKFCDFNSLFKKQQKYRQNGLPIFQYL